MSFLRHRLRGVIGSLCPATIAYEGLAVHGSSASNVWIAGADYDGVDSYALANWTGSAYTRHDTTATRFNVSLGDLYVADSTHMWLLSGAVVRFWNGSAWSTVLTRPTSPATHGRLNGLVGFSSTDVYAWFCAAGGAFSTTTGVGYYYWNGSSWSGPTSPGGDDTILNRVGAGGTQQRGAGHRATGSGYSTWTAKILALSTSTTHTLEYTGAARTDLQDIYTPDSTHGFAVGAQNLDDSTPGAYTADPLILSLSSGTWGALTAPSYSTPARFTCVGGTSTTDVWIGVTQFVAGDIYTTAGLHMLHYDGFTFTSYPLPGFTDAGLYGWLDRVWAYSSTDVWVVGTVGCSTYDLHSYSAHFDGTSWTERGIT